MHCRRDDVAGHLVRQLDNVFSKICLYDLKATFFQCLIEMDFFCHHRLTFRNKPGVCLLANPENNSARFLTTTGPMNGATILNDFLFKNFQVTIEVLKRMFLDITCRVSEHLELRHRLDTVSPCFDKPTLRSTHRLLQRDII